MLSAQAIERARLWKNPLTKSSRSDLKQFPQIGGILPREQVVIVIPTYNEAESIDELLGKLEGNVRIDHVIVVDDSSTDGTLEKLIAFQKSSRKMHVHVRPSKLGFGSAVRTGFKLALRRHSFDRLVQMDADLSHDPAYIPRLLDCKCDLVLGSRYIEGGGVIGWSLWRKLLSRAANLLATKVLGLPVRDATTGFRVYSRRATELVARLSRRDAYEFEIEALWLAVMSGFTVGEVPILFVNRRGGKSKLATPLEVFRFLKFVLTHARFRFHLRRALTKISMPR